jgi:hypothetical protein
VASFLILYEGGRQKGRRILFFLIAWESLGPSVLIAQESRQLLCLMFCRRVTLGRPTTIFDALSAKHQDVNFCSTGGSTFEVVSSSFNKLEQQKVNAFYVGCLYRGDSEFITLDSEFITLPLPSDTR